MAENTVVYTGTGRRKEAVGPRPVWFPAPQGCRERP